MSSASTDESELQNRILRAITTVRQWEEDKDFLRECRSETPFDKLMPERKQRRRDAAFAMEAFSRDSSSLMSIPPYISHPDEKDWSPSPYARADDFDKFGADDEDDDDDVFLRRFALFFQRDFMSWVNKPSCGDVPGDSDAIKYIGTRGAQTDEEKEGGASRVEEYECSTCNQTITFPRFNSPRAVWKSRRGRCGEYANAFGLACRSLGYDVRYVSDFTDHVWIEVWSRLQQRWIMADSCEGVIDEPSMYEVGWGKKLNYIVAITPHQVVDVTQRYSRQMHTSDFQARRRSIVSTEEEGQRIIRDINRNLRTASKLSKGRWEEFDRRSAAEQRFFETIRQSVGGQTGDGKGKWITEDGGGSDGYTQGRSSGSLAWRQSRQELGTGGPRDDDAEETKQNKHPASESNYSGKFQVECFLPACPPTDRGFVTITVSTPHKRTPLDRQKEASSHILVSGVPCGILPRDSERNEDNTDTTRKFFISIVVVDESTGCILQSRCYGSWLAAALFIDIVPDGRLVAMCVSMIRSEELPQVKAKRILARLGGLEMNHLSEKGTGNNTVVLYAGQVNHKPDWAVCRSTTDTEQTSVRVMVSLAGTLSNSTSKESGAKLARCEPGTVPNLIVARLPDRIMSLSRQMEATNRDKKEAFERFMKSDGGDADHPGHHRYVGYCTKQGVPVYLMDNTSYPFRHNPVHDGKAAWHTYHYLPEPLVNEDNEEDDLREHLDGIPLFDVPVDTSFFGTMLGPELLRNGSAERINTATALQNNRLVALYFSAHWCGPCRRFTPMLAEMYRTLKDTMPSHGLEIVFVTSDRDEHSFRQYFGTMPWLAVPFEVASNRSTMKQRYGVRGIPSLVVLDAISGEVVVPGDQSRQAVANACSSGDDAVVRMVKSDWFPRIPATSQAQMESLQEMAKSMLNATKEKKEKKDDLYLFRRRDEDEMNKAPISSFALRAHFDHKAVHGMRHLFSKLSAEGLDSQQAALTALILQVGGLHHSAILKENDDHEEQIPDLELTAGPSSELLWSSMICAPCLALSVPAPEAQTDVFNDALVRGNQQSGLRLIKVRRRRNESGNLVIVEVGTTDGERDEHDVNGDEWRTVHDTSRGGTIETVRIGYTVDGITDLEVGLSSCGAENEAMDTDEANVLRVPSGWDLVGFHGSTTDKNGIASLGLVCERRNQNVMNMEQSNNNTGPPKPFSEAKDMDSMVKSLKDHRKVEIVKIADTARKYLENLQREPSEPRFRSFRLSNAVCDTIASKVDGVEFLSRIGFTLSCGPETDMVASIPIASDLPSMLQVVKDVLMFLEK